MQALGTGVPDHPFALTARTAALARILMAVGEVLVAALRIGGLADRVVGLGFDQLILYVSACGSGLYKSPGWTPTRCNALSTKRMCSSGLLRPHGFLFSPPSLPI